MGNVPDSRNHRAKLHAEVRALLAREDVTGACALVIDAHGPELLAFLCFCSGGRPRGEPAFTRLCEDLWRELPTFEWDRPLVVWLYALARRAADKPERRPMYALVEAQRRARRRVEFAGQWREDPLDPLRDELRPEERALLLLRVNRRLGWRAIAEVLGEPSAEAARERFQTLRRALRARAVELGLRSDERPGSS